MENLGCSFGIDESRLEDEIDSFIKNVEQRLGHKINKSKPENINYETIKNITSQKLMTGRPLTKKEKIILKIVRKLRLFYNISKKF